MKRIARYFFFPVLLISMFILYGCPVDMDYPPDEPGTKPIDESLIGTWTCIADTCHDLQVVKVEKRNDYSYYIEVLKEGAEYLADDFYFIGYVTEIDGKKFLYAEGETSFTFFTYNYEISKNSLSLYDVSLLVGGRDAVTSTEAFRAEISASLKKPECLSERLDFRRD